MTNLNSSHLQRRFKENSGSTVKPFHEHNRQLHSKINSQSPLEISYTLTQTNLGLMIIAATEKGICSLQFGKSPEELSQFLKNEFTGAVFKSVETQQVPFKSWLKILNSYLKGETKRLDLPLDLFGTEFQQKVWGFLQKVPAGQTMSYLDLALALGKKSAVRAVASACAKNKVALIIPCHRIVRVNGQLAGYRWGLNRKEMLLNLEKQG